MREIRRRRDLTFRRRIRMTRIRNITFKSVFTYIFLVALITVSIHPLTALGSERFQFSDGDLRFCMDYTCFKSLQGDKKTYVEFYFTLSRDQLTFSEMETGYGGAYEIEMILAHEGRKPEKKSWLGAAQIDSLSQAAQRVSLFDVGYYLLDPGRYTASVKLTDLNSERKGTISERLSFPKFKEGKLQLSQIEFASRIEAATSNNKFVKSGILVLPNPLHLYGLQMPVLYFYAEIYGLQFDEGKSSTYTLQYALIDSTGDMVKSCEPKTVEKSGATAILVEQMSIITLETGTYQLRLSVTDDATGENVTQEGRFQVRMPQRPAAAADDTLFDEDRAQQERNIILYIASKKELDMYDEFNVEGKKAFLKKFWADRDPTPETELNEFKEEYLKRINFANVNFKTTIQTDGWKSDMGRIFILHGPPDDIDRHPADAEFNAWQKWIYEALRGQGNVFFIFGDLEGFGRYTLLHSNLRDEKYDENWQRWINRYRGRY
jgi:GWxTD domain-containing protein